MFLIHAKAMLTLLLAVLFAHATTVLAGESPHIVVILVDDMGFGDPGCYNRDSKISTPSIDGLARDGMRFTDAHAAGPLCHLSRYGLLTGRYPFRVDVSQWRQRPLIENGQTTFASVLQASGYRTAMVGKWHLGFYHRGYDQPMVGGPVDCGFDSFFGIRASTDIPPYYYIRDDLAVQAPTDQIDENHSDGWSPIQGQFWRAGGIAPDLKLSEVLPKFTDEAIQIIRQHDADKDPLMLYVAFPAPHTPWLPDAKFVGKSSVGMYGDFMMMVDHMIGRILDSLDENGMTDDTLVIFSSDNGPVWFDADVARFGHDSSGGLRGMKADAWEAGHRMPFIVRWPGKVRAGSTSNQLICFTDVVATFAEIVGAQLPNSSELDSESFLPVLRGQAKKPIRDSLVIPSGNGTKTVRMGDWKLIMGLGSGGFTKPSRVEPTAGAPRGQLYNLATDPGETHNLFQDHPEIVARLTRQLSGS